jgi:hypothetical protein
MIICHIVGINSLIKSEYINKCIEYNYYVIDLDDISKKIMFIPEYSKIYTEYIKPDSIGRRKELLSKLSFIWKNKFNLELDSIIYDKQNELKKIILIGLNTFYLDQRIKIFIPTDNKFFLDVPINTICEQTIKYNIDTYYTDIIKSRFPLKFLDKENIKLIREETINVYVNKGYTLKNYNEIINYIKNKNKDNIKLYYSSKRRFDNNFVDDYDLKIYNEKWLTLINTMNTTNDYKIGYAIDVDGSNNKIKSPYIKELNIGALSRLHTSCYIYEIDNIFKGRKLNKFTYLVNDEFDNTFIKREYISDIYDELNRLGAIIEKYNQE